MTRILSLVPGQQQIIKGGDAIEGNAVTPHGRLVRTTFTACDGVGGGALQPDEGRQPIALWIPQAISQCPPSLSLTNGPGAIWD